MSHCTLAKSRNISNDKGTCITSKENTVKIQPIRISILFLFLTFPSLVDTLHSHDAHWQFPFPLHTCVVVAFALHSLSWQLHVLSLSFRVHPLAHPHLWSLLQFLQKPFSNPVSLSIPKKERIRSYWIPYCYYNTLADGMGSFLRYMEVLALTPPIFLNL